MKRRPKLTLPQPKILKDLHGMRLKMHWKAERLGWKRYLGDMNKRAGHLLGKSPAPSPANSARGPALRSLGLVRDIPVARRTVSAEIS